MPITISEAARRLPFTDPALRSKIARGELTPVRIAGRIYLDERELREKYGPLLRPA